MPVFINGHGPYLFLFDTGAPGVLVAQDVAEKAGIHSTSIRAKTMMFGGTYGLSTGTAKSVRIGEAEQVNMPVTVADFRAVRKMISTNATPFDGIIGLEYMQHFKVTLDFPRRALQLTPAGQ